MNWCPNKAGRGVWPWPLHGAGLWAGSDKADDFWLNEETSVPEDRDRKWSILSNNLAYSRMMSSCIFFLFDDDNNDNDDDDDQSLFSDTVVCIYGIGNMKEPDSVGQVFSAQAVRVFFFRHENMRLSVISCTTSLFDLLFSQSPHWKRIAPGQTGNWGDFFESVWWVIGHNEHRLGRF